MANGCHRTFPCVTEFVNSLMATQAVLVVGEFGLSLSFRLLYVFSESALASGSILGSVQSSILFYFAHSKTSTSVYDHFVSVPSTYLRHSRLA